jgi:prepilin-type N-terminal cleavage/methylation domain-containing protein/prepilin-type processing-associated H-X9-DG protein
MLRPRRGFTLIELLVVISIVAILAAMLMPAVHMVRDGARSAICSNLQRQMAVANLAYAGDNDGQAIRGTGWDAAAASTGNWYQNADFLDNLEITGSGVTWPARLLCPMRASGVTTVPNVYAYNFYWGSSGSYTWGAPNTYCDITIARIPSPTKAIMFTDGLDWVVKTNVSPYRGEILGSVACAARHRGMANGSFWDGHMEAIPDVTFRITLTSDPLFLTR